MSKVVVVRSNSRLSCSCLDSPLVIMCLDSDTLLADGGTTIEGTITKAWKNSGNSCGNQCDPLWSYSVSYDETLLTDPTTPLTTDQVEGIFCQGCLTTWVKDYVARNT